MKLICEHGDNTISEFDLDAYVATFIDNESLLSTFAEGSAILSFLLNGTGIKNPHKLYNRDDIATAIYYALREEILRRMTTNPQKQIGI